MDPAAQVRLPADVDQPEYFSGTFPADSFPVHDWTARPASLPAQAWTTETTQRDGQQGGLPLTAEQGLRIYELHCRFTAGSGAIRQAEFFAYRESDRRMLEGALERHHSGAPVEPTTWIRASAADVEMIRKLGVRETGMLASASDFHTFHKFKPGGRKQAASAYLEAVERVLEAGIRPRLHLEDATRAAPEFLGPFTEAVLAAAAPYGAGLRPKFRICDTMGLGLPYDDVALPRSISRLVRLVGDLGVAPEDLEFHPHNDTWLVVANCLAAVRAGCAVVNGTCLGKGERTGNAPIEGVLLHLIGMGYYPGERPEFTVLNELADLYTKLGEPVAPKYPLYGKDAHRTRAGIHADGLNKHWPMYAPFDVPALLGRPLEVSLTKDSGAAGVQFLVRQRLGLDLAKDHPGIRRLHDWTAQQFATGRQTAIEWEELEPLARRELGPAAG